MTSEVTQAALEPCPFCGGNAKVDDEESDDVGGYFASCTKCPVSAWGDTREEAIAAWNTRLTAQSGEGRSGAGEDALDRIEATINAAERCMNASPFWDDNSRYAGKALLDYPRSQIAVERAALNARQSGEGEQGSAIGDIAAERQRQIEAEGWTPEHDDEHDDGQMATAAATYAYAASLPDRLREVISGIYTINNNSLARALWPWENSWWKPSTPRRDLVKAGALIVAEIERLDRAALRATDDAGGA